MTYKDYLNDWTQKRVMEELFENKKTAWALAPEMHALGNYIDISNYSDYEKLF